MVGPGCFLPDPIKMFYNQNGEKTRSGKNLVGKWQKCPCALAHGLVQAIVVVVVVFFFFFLISWASFVALLFSFFLFCFLLWFFFFFCFFFRRDCFSKYDFYFLINLGDCFFLSIFFFFFVLIGPHFLIRVYVNIYKYIFSSLHFSNPNQIKGGKLNFFISPHFFTLPQFSILLIFHSSNQTDP